MDTSLRIHARAARREIASGTLRGAELLAQLLAVPFVDRDEWTDELLGFDALTEMDDLTGNDEEPPTSANLPRGAVPYLPCGVDEILAMVREVPLRADDDLVDLGSGLGRVLILAHLLTGARGLGVEVQRRLVHRARSLCSGLALDGVTFLDANAAEIALDGSVFFLYAPFNGPLLASVLRRIEDVARRRAIVLACVGLELRDVPWLVSRPTTNVALSLYDSTAHGVPHRPR